MNKKIQTETMYRNRSYSDNPNKKNLMIKQNHSIFTMAGKHTLDNQHHDQIESNNENSMHLMKSSTVSHITNKLNKIPNFVHLPKVSMNQHQNYQIHTMQSQPTVESIRTLNKYETLKSDILIQEEPGSFIYQTNQKLEQSQNHNHDVAWNIQKLQVALEHVNLQENESPVQQRTKRKVKPKRQKQRDFDKIQQQKQRVKRQRQRNMQMVSGFLSGKATFMWLFVIKSDNQEELSPLREIYKTYFQNDYEIPICKNYQEATKFLKIQSCFFKVVSDLDNSELLIKETQHNKNIIAIYLYNPEKQRGISKAFQLKRNSRKIRGMFMDLDDAAQLAEEQIENEAKFIRVGHELQRQRNRLRFPAFFILNGIDSTDVTSYRMCLYSSLSIKQAKQREIYLKQFTDMVELRYLNNQKQLNNLEEYKMIDHSSVSNQKKHRQIISFYVRETFYYALLNAMLRLSRNSEQFRPCVIPFNQTYLAIKYLYKQQLKINKNKCCKFTAYRGAKLRNSDVKSLQIGSLIQLLGFTSTSMLKQQAQKFMDNDSYLIEIIVETTAQNEEQMDYDHGFLNINQNKLAAQAFQAEEEVLFNALNVYQVIRLDLQSAVRTITLKYGAIVELMRSKKSLKGIQGSVLQNYRYCINSFKNIQDDGDAFRFAEQYDQCVSYYQSKIQNGEQNAKVFAKLAGAQLEVGDINAAYENAINSLSIIQGEIKDSPLNSSYKIPLELAANVFDRTQDIFNYQRSTNLWLQLETNWQTKCKKVQKRVLKKLGIGDYKGCKQDIKMCRQILKNEEESYEIRRKQLKKKYFFTSLYCLCSKKMTEMNEQRQIELLKIEQDQIIFESKKDTFIQLQLKNEVIASSFYQKIGNDFQYRQSLRRAEQHMKLLCGNKKESNSIRFAKFQVLKASTMDINVNFDEYQKIMQQAIDKIRQQNPLHPHIAKYNQMLGLKRYEMIQQYLNVPNQQLTKSMENNKILKFDYDRHKAMYKKCKQSLKEAANQLAFQKGNAHIKTIQINNHLATLDYDFSLLKQAQSKTKVNFQISTTANTQIAKCNILLAKIALAKGQLKRASIHIERAMSTLKNALVKSNNPNYDRILMRHPLYLEICILKSKIFNRQQKHNLALKELQMIQRLVKLQKPYNIAMLANLQEEQAEILVCLGETQNFQSCVLRSVQLRQQAMGKYNIPNAISFSNLFKYLRYTQDFQNSVKYHQKSTEIFSRFPSDHPNAWVLHLSNGLVFYQRNQFQLALPQLQIGMRIAQRRYSTSHINFMKIKLQFAKLLKGMGQFQRALKMLQNLEVIISKNIKQSTAALKIQHETDDQKILVRKSTLKEMKQLYERSKNQKNEARVLVGIEKCENNLRDCQFIEQQKYDSLKSLN